MKGTAAGAIGLTMGIIGQKGSAQAEQVAGKENWPFRYRGVWMWDPSLLDEIYGPWADSTHIGQGPVVLWKKALDWFAEHDINVVVSSLQPAGDAHVRPSEVPSFMSRRVTGVSGWAFHYVNDFPRYPEARVFGPDFTRRNREICNEIFAYAKQKGIVLFPHHYNFAAPEPFVMAHPEVYNGRSPRAGRHEDAHLRIVGNTSWNQAVYRDFMQECWREFFENCPDCPAMMVTPGEAFRNPEHFVPLDPRVAGHEGGFVNTIAHFVRTFVSTLESAGKMPIVRTWCAGTDEAARAFPKGVAYVVKYSVFDAVDTPPDPLVKSWLDAGHRIWSSQHITGENAGPITWFHPRFHYDYVERSRNLGAEGILSLGGIEFGDLKVDQLPLLAHVLYVTRKGAYDRSYWVSLFREIFGQAGDSVLTACELYAQPVLNISKMVYDPTEGFTWVAHQGGTRGVSSLRAAPPDEPPEWVREGIASVQQIVRYLQRNPWSEDAVKIACGDAEPPDVSFERAVESAKRGLEMMNEAAGRVSSSASAEFASLRAGARMSYHFGGQWLNVMRSQILYSAVRGPSPVSVKKELARRCLDAAHRAIAHVRAQVEAIYDVPHASPRMMTAAWRHWENELERLSRDLAEYL